LTSDSAEHWANKMFVQYGHLFLPVLESMKIQSPLEVESISKIFDSFQIKRTAKVLDLFCGIGRHAPHLAEKGYEVVGYDPSKLYIDRANEWIDKKYSHLRSKIRFYEGDQNRLVHILKRNADLNFSAIIIMYNSIGYSDKKDDICLLKQLLRIASPGCILILETENRDCTIRHFQPYVCYKLDGIEIHEFWRINLETSTAESTSKFYQKDSCGNLRLELNLNRFLRLYSLHELISILNEAGWEYQNSYGSLSKLSKAGYDDEYLITVSKNTSKNE
jgi:SAM-dependent methyltransferase